jgi:hydrogenase-4 component B
VVLTLLVIVVAGLLLAAASRAVLPARPLVYGCAGACGVVVVLALVALVDRSQMAALALPVGPAGMSLRLTLDLLGASFLLLLFLGALAREWSGVAGPKELPSPYPLPQGEGEELLALAGTALVLLAADAFSLVAGVLLVSAGSLRLGVLAGFCLVAALALAEPAAFGGFAILRAAPPEGWRAGALVLLVAVAACALAGIRGRTGAPLALYLPLRLLADLGGPALPSWSGLPLLVLGGAAVLLGPLRAATATTVHGVVRAGSAHQLGMAAAGVGLALLARAVDRPDITLLALQAAWLWLVCYVLCQTLLLRCAEAVEHGAETRRLDRLGGLIRGMTRTAVCTLAGLFAAAMLPPGLGFAALWLSFQSLLAIARIGGLGLQFLMAALAALTALSVGLCALAVVRLFGVAFLGRPRTPRTAVAEEAPWRAQIVTGTLAALTVVLGIVPGLALLPAPGMLPALLRLGGVARGYSPVGTAVLLALAGLMVFLVIRRLGTGERRSEAAWTGGFAPPPSWLPFGDPATQYGPLSFAEPLRLLLAHLPSPERLSERATDWRRSLNGAGAALRSAVGAWSATAALVALVAALLVCAIAS